jgi:hypothetical protein
MLMAGYDTDKPQKLWHPMITAAIAMVLAIGFAIGGYKAGFERGFDHARIEYVDVPMEVPVPGPTVVKKVFVAQPRHCPTPPSVADALNEYEALIRP